MTSHKSLFVHVEFWEIFSLDIPESWSCCEEESVVSLFNESDGVGVLQFSLARRKTPQKATSQEAIVFATNFASQRKWTVPSVSIRELVIDDSPATEFSFQENGGSETEYWRVWHVMGNMRIAFVTYNCIASDKEVEKSVCDSIVTSFRWL